VIGWLKLFILLSGLMTWGITASACVAVGVLDNKWWLAALGFLMSMALLTTLITTFK
jgi:hypothetical protein